MNIIKICGIKLRVHWLGIIAAFIIVGMGHGKKLSITFLIIFCHEMAHTLAAVLYKYKIKEIEFFPFGGVAKIDGIVGNEPQKETSIALAGPIVNLAMAALAFGWGPVEDIYSTRGYFISANLSIALFNLLPIFPLDGGRIVRSCLAKIIGLKSSTNFTIGLSRFFALGLMGWGIYQISTKEIRGIFIALLAVFILAASTKERHMTPYLFIKEINDRQDILFKKGVLKANYIITTEHTMLSKVVEEFIPNKYHIIAVLNTKGQIIGSLTEADVTSGLVNFGLSAPVSVLLYNRKKW